jgi:putative DNA primase/helicase
MNATIPVAEVTLSGSHASPQPYLATVTPPSQKSADDKTQWAKKSARLDWAGKPEAALGDALRTAAQSGVELETAVDAILDFLRKAQANLDDPHWEDVLLSAIKEHFIQAESPAIASASDGPSDPAPTVNAEQIEAQESDELVNEFGEPFYIGPKGSFKGINERYFAGLHLREVTSLYDPALGFYDYSPVTGLWVPVSEEQKMDLIARRMLKFCRENENDFIEPAICSKNLAAIVRQLKSISFRAGAFEQRFVNFLDDANEVFLAHMTNGVLVLNNNGLILRPFSPDYYSRFQCPVVYNEKAKAPEFLAMLEGRLENEADDALVLQYAGQCLTGYNMTKRILILDGDQDSGKTTFMKLIGGVVGEDNTSQLRTEHLSERFELNRYAGKPLLYGTDVANDFLSTNQAEKLKSMVGGDWLESEAKHRNKGQRIRGNFNIIIGTNNRLSPPSDTHVGAWRTRFLCVPFKASKPFTKIADYDKLLLQKEGSGIFNLMLNGLLDLRQELKKSGGYRLTAVQQRRIDDLLAEAESVRHFVLECIERSEGESVKSEDLVEIYGEYCADKGWEPKPPQSFYKQLRQEMLRNHHAALSNSLIGGRGYRGIRLTGKYERIITQLD